MGEKSVEIQVGSGENERIFRQNTFSWLFGKALVELVPWRFVLRFGVTEPAEEQDDVRIEVIRVVCLDLASRTALWAGDRPDHLASMKHHLDSGPCSELNLLDLGRWLLGMGLTPDPHCLTVMFSAVALSGSRGSSALSALSVLIGHSSDVLNFIRIRKVILTFSALKKVCAIFYSEL